MRFFRCEHCGNIVEMIKDSQVPVVCCGQNMTELVPNTSEGAFEKHLPVVTAEGNKVTVKVSEVAHPMMEAHYIQWIAIETEKGSQIVYLKPDEEPKAEFMLADGDKLTAAYEYCNLHGLWKAE